MLIVLISQAFNYLKMILNVQLNVLIFDNNSKIYLFSLVLCVYKTEKEVTKSIISCFSFNQKKNKHLILRHLSLHMVKNGVNMLKNHSVYNIYYNTKLYKSLNINFVQIYFMLLIVVLKINFRFLVVVFLAIKCIYLLRKN